MRRVSCPSPSEASCLLSLLPAALMLAGQVAGAEQGGGAHSQPPALIRPGNPRIIAERPLPPQRAERALVFVGGFGDEVHGIMSQLEAALPPLDAARPEQRGYYQWNGGSGDGAQQPQRLAGALRAFLRANPQAELILIGHSLGASTALKALHRLEPGEGRLYLLTLDPVDKSTRPARPAAVAWWGNAWLSHSRSRRDALFALGGRWNACKGADCNLHFDGRRRSSWGQLPIHDDAAAFLLARPAGAPASLLEQLRAQLGGGRAGQADKP